MVVKFFSNKKGGSSKAIDYLLNEREAQGTAKVLQGDPELTRSIINSIEHKQKTTVGCLAFEEKNITEEQKYKLMKDFENHLLPDMQDRYNILWVEHTDKDILELNFVIPKIDLETQKSLNPYYHKADLPRVEKWQDLQNLQYGYSNPKDPSKARTLETNPKEIGLSQDYVQLDKLLHNQNLQSRSHLIELLESNNITITRKGKDYLSIKLPDSKKAKKFKGEIYSEQFTSPKQLRELSQAIRTEAKQFNQRDTSKECTKLRKELNSYVQDKANKLKSQFKSSVNKFDNVAISRDTIDSFNSPVFKQKENNIISRNDIQAKQSNLYHSSSRSIDLQQRQKRHIYKSEGLENDSTGATITERTTRSRRIKYNAYKEARNARNRVSEELTKDNHFQQIEQSKYSYAFGKIGERFREIRNKIVNKTKSFFTPKVKSRGVNLHR